MLGYYNKNIIHQQPTTPNNILTLAYKLIRFKAMHNVTKEVFLLRNYKNVAQRGWGGEQYPK